MPYLHRSLLWYRPVDLLASYLGIFRFWLGELELEPEPVLSGRIDFSEAEATQLQQPPSWSWMAYEGTIDFLHIKSPEWDRSITFSEPPGCLKVRVAKLRGTLCLLQSSSSERNGRGRKVRDQEGNQTAEIWFDQGIPAICGGLRCALIGRDASAQEEGRKYYVLLLPAEGASPLERLGVGWIYERAIDFDEMDHLEIA
ncbi:hypothetical protein K456DRAFT_1665351 [Colletotrichum gloeosporioides 23]|nr:hypothetical protein K456DRAFT_1665351 [Colletotrichum gloeosporioides 23]